jgi:hypothetical protein
MLFYHKIRLLPAKENNSHLLPLLFYALHFPVAVVNTSAPLSAKLNTKPYMKIMRKFFALSCIALLTLAALSGPAAAEDFITLTLPETVIADATAAILPLRIDAHSKSIEGDIHIINISELQLTDNHLACRLHLAGTNLVLLTEIAGHEIKLKVGEVEIDFKAEAAIRFDTKKQILYIKPMVKDVATGGAGAGADIGQVLVALLNDREFPVAIQDLDPLIARAGSKTITFNSTIADIKAKPHSVQLSLRASVVTN